MSKIIVILMGVLMFVGCASLRKEVFEKIQEGDSKDKVVKVLGQPDQYSPSKDGTGQEWYYARRADLCGFFIKNDTVKEIGCWNNPNYTSPLQRFGRVLHGAGQGMENASRQPAATQQRPINCTTTQAGNSIFTSCQ